MFYPKSIEGLEKVVRAAAKRFDVSRETALFTLLDVLVLSRWAKSPVAPERTAEDGDITITCELCQNEQWWRDNYGSLWEWARWWHCGPLGLDCGGFAS